MLKLNVMPSNCSVPCKNLIKHPWNSLSFLLRFFICASSFTQAMLPKYALYLLSEMMLLSIMIVCLPRILRFLVIPLIALHTLQLTNLLMTGNFVVATTLENLNSASDVGHTVYYALAIGTLYIITWLPTMMGGGVNYLKNKDLLFHWYCLAVFFLSNPCLSIA